jgi:hypothetical protein
VREIETEKRQRGTDCRRRRRRRRKTDEVRSFFFFKRIIAWLKRFLEKNRNSVDCYIRRVLIVSSSKFLKSANPF